MAAASAVFAIVAVARAAGAAPCSSDTFTVGRTALSVTVCTLGARTPAGAHPKGKAPPGATGTVTETVTARGHAPVTQAISYTRLPSEATARRIDDVPLQSLGIAKSLHLTLAITGGTARVEHALLIPGAIVLK